LPQSLESHASCEHGGFLWTNKPTPLGQLDRHHPGTVKRTKQAKRYLFSDFYVRKP
jgi:hypothetical protein